MYIVLDLETTGLSALEDSIIEAAFVKISSDFQELDRLSFLINPEKPIPQMISQITGIFDADVAEAPVFSEMRDEIQAFLGDAPIVGHNIGFDVRFLESHGISLMNNPKIDTFFLANFLCYEVKSLNLWYLAQHFDIDLSNAHRALDDTLATVQVFQRLTTLLSEIGATYPEVCTYFFSQCRDAGIQVLAEQFLKKPSKKLTDETFVSHYIEKIEKNIGSTHEIATHDMPLDITNFLSSLETFETRENQKKMLDMVDTTLTQWKKAIIEAPTGIGKTFAYLLPAIKLSVSLGEPVHISTSTKALQDQIFYKDAAFLREHLGYDFSYTKLKGKRNYLGIAPFMEFVESHNDMTSTCLSFLMKIFLWSITSELGELDELDFYGEEFSYLSQIHAGDGFVFDDANIYKSKEFSYRARQRARNSNIVITNNHILFQDIVSDGSLLGGVKNLIVDEAHALEDVVTQSMKKNISFSFVQTIAENLEKKIRKYELPWEELGFIKQRILFESSEVFSILEGSIYEKFSFSTPYKSILLTEKYFSDHEESALVTQKLLSSLQDLKKSLSQLDEKILKHFARDIQDITYIESVMQEVFGLQDTQKYIYYITHDDERGTQLHTTLLEPGAFLEAQLWNQLDSVILTSATLQMDDDFAYMKHILHIDDFETLALPSDFDYSSQALVFIPHDLGSIKNNLDEIKSFLQVFFETVRGNTLVLFTAFSAIREIFSSLKHDLEQKNIHLLAQSISGSKQKQIDFFKQHADSSILLWTDTFWEGIDIPGQDLQYLVVHKIPFSVPTDPIFIARSQLFAKSFEDYAITKSILKLKQWFWRLIRSKKDTGVIVFLDDRIYTTNWGEKFFHAFPKDIKIRSGESKKLIELLRDHN